MKLKEVMECTNINRSSTPGYKKALRTLRPKQHIPGVDSDVNQSPEEKCIEEILKQNLDGTFRDVDMPVQLRKYEWSVKLLHLLLFLIYQASLEALSGSKK